MYTDMRMKSNDALFQGSFAAIHAAGVVMFGVGAVMSGLAAAYHARRWWEVVRQ